MMTNTTFRNGLFLILTCAIVQLIAQPNFEEMRRQMLADWKDTTKYRPVYLTEQEKAYFRNCAPRRLTYPTDSDDDYYPIDNYMDPRAGVKIRCKKSELRTMTEDERYAYASAFRAWNTAKADNTTGRTEQEVFVTNHRSTRAFPAHDGACFTLWHDVYLELFEEALKKHNESACPPYWDSCLDQCLNDPSDSVLWSEDLMGTPVGQVTSGLFANLQIRPIDCRQTNTDPYIYRDVIKGSVGAYYLYSDSMVAGIYSRAPDNYTQLCARVNPEFENTHGYGHMYVRGSMAPLSCSPSEPMFWAHHENVNRLYKNYISEHPMGANRSDYYPKWNATEPEPGKRYNDSLKPFDEIYPGITCSTRLNAEFDTWGQYRPPPKNCTVDSDCLSDMLWCNPNCKGKRRCSAKLREGAACASYPLNACYKPKSCSGKNMTCKDLGAGKVCTCA